MAGVRRRWLSDSLLAIGGGTQVGGVILWVASGHATIAVAGAGVGLVLMFVSHAVERWRAYHQQPPES